MTYRPPLHIGGQRVPKILGCNCIKGFIEQDTFMHLMLCKNGDKCNFLVWYSQSKLWYYAGYCWWNMPFIGKLQKSSLHFDNLCEIKLNALMRRGNYQIVYLSQKIQQKTEIFKSEKQPCEDDSWFQNYIQKTHTHNSCDNLSKNKECFLIQI